MHNGGGAAGAHAASSDEVELQQYLEAAAGLNDALSAMLGGIMPSGGVFEGVCSSSRLQELHAIGQKHLPQVNDDEGYWSCFIQGIFVIGTLHRSSKATRPYGAIRPDPVDFCKKVAALPPALVGHSLWHKCDASLTSWLGNIAWAGRREPETEQ